MTPDMSRELGSILGLNYVTIEERQQITASLSGADTIAQLPKDIRDLLKRIQNRSSK